MTFPVTNLMTENSSRYYFLDDVRVLLETHMDILRKSSNTVLFDVKPIAALKYAGDFYGLLTSIGIKPCYHWLVMRMNGYYSSTDFDGQRLTLIHPNFQEVELIINTHRAARSQLKNQV